MDRRAGPSPFIIGPFADSAKSKPINMIRLAQLWHRYDWIGELVVLVYRYTNTLSGGLHV